MKARPLVASHDQVQSLHNPLIRPQEEDDPSHLIPQVDELNRLDLSDRTNHNLERHQSSHLPRSIIVEHHHEVHSMMGLVMVHLLLVEEVLVVPRLLALVLPP